MKKIFEKVIVRILSIVGICVVLILGLHFAGVHLPQNFWDKIPGYNKTAKLDTEIISKKFANASELVTQKLTMEGYSTYEDEGIPFLTKGNFVMTYKSQVTAGIDASKISFRVEEGEHTLYIHLPQAEIFSAAVDPGTISYHGESVAIFNFNNKEDANKAQKMAEEDARKAAVESGILDNANSYAQTLVKGILQGSVDGYELKFE